MCAWCSDICMHCEMMKSSCSIHHRLVVNRLSMARTPRTSALSSFQAHLRFNNYRHPLSNGSPCSFVPSDWNLVHVNLHVPIPWAPPWQPPFDSRSLGSACVSSHFLTHSSTDGRLEGFHLLATNSTAVNMDRRHLFDVLILLPLDPYPVVALLIM